MLITHVGSGIERDLLECADWLDTRACSHYGPGQPCLKPGNDEVLSAAVRLRQIARHGGSAITIVDDLLKIAKDLVRPRDQDCAAGWCSHPGCHDRRRVLQMLCDAGRQLLDAAGGTCD